MVRYLIWFSYIGTRFRGIQNLKEYPGMTIQGIFEDALQTLNPLNHPVTTTCSRTDKGVHALKNAIHVDLEHCTLKETFKPHTITERLNSYFERNDHDIVINKTCIVPKTFHARHAKWRSYVYRLALLKPHLKKWSLHPHIYDEFLPIRERKRCCIVHGSLNPTKIQEAVKLFIGTHDFTTFSKHLHKDGKDPLKTVFDCKFYPSGEHGDFFPDSLYENIQMWEFYIQADSYLYNQIRKMVGTLLGIGYGFLTLDDLKKMLEEPSVHMWRKSVLVPACGLYLVDVCYDFMSTV